MFVLFYFILFFRDDGLFITNNNYKRLDIKNEMNDKPHVDMMVKISENVTDVLIV
jgi:hypothetical protein